MEKIWKFFIIKSDWMGIGTGMGIDDKEDVKAYKSGNSKSIGNGINNIFN